MDHPTPDAQITFRDALTNFKQATRRLEAAWDDMPGDAVIDYPEGMPSFDEFALQIERMQVKTYLPPIVPVDARVVCTCIDDRGGHFAVQPGEFGTVVECTEEILRIRLDLYHDGAEEWNNQVTITPDDGADRAPSDERRRQMQAYFNEHYSMLTPIIGIRMSTGTIV